MHQQLINQWRDASTKELIQFVLANFHEKHRQQLPELIQLARKVEGVHNDHPACPAGLADLLTEMSNELESHMMKEEQILFPMLAGGVYPNGPIAVMEEEHTEHDLMLKKLANLTNNGNAPRGACGSWIMLYEGTRELAEDLQQHIALENEVLFREPQAAAPEHGKDFCCGSCQ
ncbi:Iron-sulfur cluster repair protein YtfE [Pseudidiomarina piscicola]|uniref:Iron-sulfur cluster repair protein YtfE n=1 Tax=Pseudidiomarina piscicola TaxID=2614830 RepID=A0A6S6WN36_9GAMM|nr:hemerythrin domain-containing protein [Pseudidiomarina piscicola]CAB0151469.1 Iron-sulfur cluster repair protein YtfE [Pseudidiomarina piscicola]VZT40948.1 Iron-sulfur cluster repair protein YtfE [Pseudomonas aeruginosa]